jgi:titin
MALSTFNTFNAWGSIARSSPPTTPGQPVFISASITSLTYSFAQSAGSTPITYSAFLSSVALSGGQSGTGNPTSYTISGLVSNTIYTVGMNATNFVATSNQSPTTNMLTVPSAPTTVSASTGNTNTQGASITFTAPTGNGTITSYTITSTPTATLTYSGTTSPISITSGLTSNTAYTFTITATNNSGTSTSSTAAATTYPDNPTSLVITPGTGNIAFAFSKPSGTITGYNVYINSAIVSSNLTSTTYNATNLSADIQYTYKISALNGSQESYGLSGVTGTIPFTAPTIVGVALSSADASTTVIVSVLYTRNPVFTYIYYVTSNPDSLQGSNRGVTADLQNISVSNLTPLKRYTFVAYCYNGYGGSPNSTSSNPIITGPPIPLSPSVTAITDTSATITFGLPTYGTDSTITSYTVTANPVNGPGNTIITSTNTTGSPITITGLTGSSTYNFSITTSGNSQTSAKSSNTSNTVLRVTTTVIIVGTKAVIAVTYNSAVYTSYTVTSNVGGFTANITTNSPYILSNLVSNTSYTFSATGAYVSGGSSLPGNTTAAQTANTTVNAIGAITGITAPTHLFAFVSGSATNNGTVAGTGATSGNTKPTLTASPSFFPKTGRGGINFPGNNLNSCLTLPSNQLVTSSNGATIAFYYYITSYNTGYFFFAGDGTNNLSVILNSTNLAATMGSGNSTSFNNTNASLGTWTHVAFVFTTGTTNHDILYYINGVLSQTSSSQWDWPGALTYNSVGIGGAGNNNSILGQMADFRIYNYQLTAAQVAAVYYNL